MHEIKAMEGPGVLKQAHLELQCSELSDKPARDAKTGSRAAVHDEVGGSRVDGVQVRGGGHDVDGAPRGDDWLPVEGKVVEVVP